MTDRTEHHGVIVPMVTPVTAAGELDEDAVCRIVDHLVEGGVDGIFVLGTTGEKASVPPAMQIRLVDVTAARARNRARVYAGISDNSLGAAVEAAAHFSRHSVAAAVAHPPSYYPLEPEDIFEYYRQLASRIRLPLLLYNIPSTTRISVPVDVIARLSEVPNIAGLKDSEHGIERARAIVAATGGKGGFALLTGSAAQSLEALRLGMDGMVPSSGNLVPSQWRALCDRACRKDWAAAQKLQDCADAIGAVLQKGRNLSGYIAALKAGMSLVGLCGPAMLPPLRPLPAAETEAIAGRLSAFGEFPTLRAGGAHTQSHR